MRVFKMARFAVPVWALVAITVGGVPACGHTDPPPTADASMDHSMVDVGAPDVPPECVDMDHDGYGLNCPLGPDCNDNDPTITNQCYRCLTPAAGCTCTPGTDAVPCDVLTDTDHAVEGECHLGQRNCVDGEWGHCVAVGNWGRTISPPSACQGSCNPMCQVTTACPNSSSDIAGSTNISIGANPPPVFCPTGSPGGITLTGGTAMPTGSSNCTNLCLQQANCTGGGTTSVSGVVYAPTPPQFLNPGQMPDPLYNALVYVPNAPVAPFAPGISCQQCGAVSGAPLVSAVTGPDGSFTLTNVPVGTNIPLVIQLGRWRRQITIPVVARCTNTVLTPAQTRMPRTHLEGDIPLIAMVTGNVDALECVLRKIGIDDSEFTVPAIWGGSGRVQLFQANGAVASAGAAPPASSLWGSSTTMSAYDMVLFACEGFENNQASASQARVINYANLGGRVMATHYNYTWLYNATPWSGTAAWSVNQSNPPDPELSTIDQTFAKGAAMAQWLWNVNASPTFGRIYLTAPRRDFDGPVAPSQNWVYGSIRAGSTTATNYLHYTFNTPVAAPPANQCGRVVFSDFHVNNAGSTGGWSFPWECDAAPMTAQEKILEFMLFDLASCIVPTGVPACAMGQTVCGSLCCGAGQICQTSGGGATCFTPYPPTGTYRQTIDASTCGAGMLPQWTNLVFAATTPPGTSITATFFTASTAAGVPSATAVPLGTIPPTASPIDIGAALRAAGVSANLPYGEVVFTLNSDPTRLFAPTINGYQVNFNCTPGT